MSVEKWWLEDIGAFPFGTFLRGRAVQPWGVFQRYAHLQDGHRQNRHIRSYWGLPINDLIFIGNWGYVTAIKWSYNPRALEAPLSGILTCVSVLSIASDMPNTKGFREKEVKGKNSW